MKKKRMITWICLALCMAVLSGCNKAKEEPPAQTETVQQPAEVPETGTEAEGSEVPEDSGTEALETPVRIWGEVVSASAEEIIVDNQSEASSKGEMILLIDPEQSFVLDAATGLPVQAEEIQKGSFEAYLGPVMTMSLPPQTTPYVVLVNLPEGALVPRYAVVQEVSQEDGVLLVMDADGTTYRLPSDVEVFPHLTRNIVTLEDITEGRKCLIWLSDDKETAERVMLFAE